MLLERATGLAAKITQYRELRSAADEAEQFETRAKQFAAISERLSRTLSALGKLADAGVTISFVPNDGAGYAAKAKALRAAIRDNPAAINDPPFDLKYEFTDRLTMIAGAAEKAMTEAWKAYVAKRGDFGSNFVLSALARSPSSARASPRSASAVATSRRLAMACRPIRKRPSVG
jgi:hypothetical protein